MSEITITVEVRYDTFNNQHEVLLCGLPEFDKDNTHNDIWVNYFDTEPEANEYADKLRAAMRDIEGKQHAIAGIRYCTVHNDIAYVGGPDPTEPYLCSSYFLGKRLAPCVLRSIAWTDQ